MQDAVAVVAFDWSRVPSRFWDFNHRYDWNTPVASIHVTTPEGVQRRKPEFVGTPFIVDVTHSVAAALAEWQAVSGLPFRYLNSKDNGHQFALIVTHDRPPYIRWLAGAGDPVIRDDADGFYFQINLRISETEFRHLGTLAEASTALVATHE